MTRRNSEALRIVLPVLAAIPTGILSFSLFCTWLVSQGAPSRLRLPFRVICHGIVTRCLEVFGEPMPICARCTGIYVGMLAGLLLFWALPFVSEKALRIAAMVALTPLAIDGLTQLARLRESTNSLRVATGITAGFAFGLWVLAALQRANDGRETIS